MALQASDVRSVDVAESKLYSRDELTKHVTRQDLWIALHNRVYNVTNYLDDHPGGEAILLGVAGTDATSAFEDAGHSDDARATLVKFAIGVVPTSDQPAAKAAFRSKPVQSAFASTTITRPWGLTRNGNVIKTIALISTIAVAEHYSARKVGIEILERVLYVVPPFWRGIAVSSAVSAALFASLGLQLSKTLVINETLRKYPPVLGKPKVCIHGPRKFEVVRTVLNSHEYQPFLLLEKKQMSHNVYRFVFSLPRMSDVLGLPVGQHINMRATINASTITRSFTPVSSNLDLGRMELVVKIYPGSKIGNYLRNLSLNEQVSIRGPSGSFQKYHRFLCDRIGMIAGGTGITPMYQFIRTICEDSADETKITLLYGNHTEDDILMRGELDKFQRMFPAKFQVHYVLGSPPHGWMGHVGRITQAMMEKHLPPVQEGSKYLVCGSDGMVAAMKKSLVAMGCEEPKAVSHATDQVFIF